MSVEEIENIWKRHISVLLDELINSITIFKDKRNVIIDCTLWMWWHGSEIIKKLNKGDLFIWFDADIKNLELAKKRINEVNKEIEVILINSNFVNLKKELDERWINKITGIYYDLWLSSLHVDEADRWFSFKLDWPLDMRFDKNSWSPASNIVNRYKWEDLLKIFKEYWEEPSSRKLVEEIIKIRKIKKFETTKELVDVIWKVSKNPKSKNRIFQALRIETNKELENMKISLSDAINLLEIDWIIFVISFHSLEDRIVKQIFKKESRDCICSDLICTCKHVKTIKIITKKPIRPSDEEVKINTRSRSAKARFAQKIRSERSTLGVL